MRFFKDLFGVDFEAIVMKIPELGNWVELVEGS